MHPIPGGEILREQFPMQLGMTAHELSQAIHIVKSRRGVTADPALLSWTGARQN